MGSNQSKLCSGVPEREFRRALQDKVQQMYVTPPDLAEDAVHIYCCEDEVERYLDEIYADPVVFHFDVEKAPEIKPESSVEGGEKPGAAATAVSLEVKVAEPGGNVTGKSKPSGDVEVRSQPYGDMVVKTDAQVSELELTLAGLCNQVLDVLHVGDFSERTKGNSPVEDLSPSSLEAGDVIEKTSRESSERTKGNSPAEDLSPSSLETEDVIEKTSRESSKRTKGHSPVEDLSPSSLEPGDVIEKTSRESSERTKGTSPAEDLSPSSLETEDVIEKTSRESSERTKGHSAVEDLSPSSLESEHVEEKSSGHSSERTKGHSAVEDLSPSSLESEHVEEKSSGHSSERTKGHSAVENLSSSSLELEHVEEKSSGHSSKRMKGHSAVEDLLSSSLESEHVEEKSSGHSSERPKGHSAVEELSPSSLESVPSILSSGSQTRSPPIGAVESLNPGDVRHPDKDTSLADALKAPCGLELPTGDMLGAAEEPTTGQMQFEEASSEETLEEADECSSEDTIEEMSDASSGGTLEEVGEAPPDLGPEEMADGCSDIKADLETKQLAEILLSLSRGLPRAASEPLSIQKEREGKVPEDYSDGGKADARLEVRPKRAQHEISATVDSGGKKEQVIASKVFLMESHGRSVQTLRKKTVAIRQDSLLLARGAVDLDSFQKDGAIPTPETTKEKEHQTSAVQNMEAQPSTNIAETTGAASSPKALSETAETGQ
ncbi:UNVERIFIED_CONTAM: hypothetical protein K2H54_017143, partial [Gekko kuhli]